MIAPTPLDILRFAGRELAADHRCALVTLTGIEGSSPRGVGTQMAVAGDGRSLGSFSGGCIEAAVVAEALAVIAAGAARRVRFGLGSPYLDVKLPCGGGIDLAFSPLADGEAVAGAISMLDGRRPAALALDVGNGQFEVRYKPGLRILAAGQGDDLIAFARLAHCFGAGIEAFCPNNAALSVLRDEAIRVARLDDRTQWPRIATDPWTAIVFLFHDRDWEEFLLPQILALPAFYIGSVGSPNTHRARLAHLRASGVDEQAIERLRGPIGLIQSTREPATLALSVLSEIVALYNGLAT